MAVAIDTSTDHHPPSWNYRSVHEYLAQNDIKCSSATSMDGGHSTYVWRLEDVSIPQKHDSKSAVVSEKCVLKFAEEFAKRVDIPFPPERLKWELRALKSNAVRQACALEPSIRVPGALFAKNNALVLEWAGDVDLRTAILTGAVQDEGAISSKLGRWLAHMHKAGMRDETAKSLKDNEMTEKVLSLEASSMRDNLEKHSVPSPTIERAMSIFHEPAGGMQTGVILDFRPMNVLLSRLKDPQPSIAVIDMECSTFGDPALDFNIWVAEALVIEAQCQRKSLVSSFLTAYACEAGPEIVTKSFVCKVAVLIGAMWSLCDFALWNAQDDAQYWKKTAAEYIAAGAEQDLQWLAKSDLRPLLRFDPDYIHLFE